MSPRIRLVVADVDGCLTPGEGGVWDWEALRAMQEINVRARRGDAVPAITLCTGRQEPYVEVMMQAIGGYVPCIYENGGGLYLPGSYRFLEHPAITPHVRAALTGARARLQEHIVAAGLGYFQPGKEVSMSIYPLPGTPIGELEGYIRTSLISMADDVLVRTSASCVDVTPAGVDKGSGIRWLADVAGITIEEMGGIGDSPGDLAFLQLAGASAAPANAMPVVKAAVQFVSPFANARGVVDIIRRWM